VLFVRELAKHTSKTPVITLVNPGFCHSELVREATGVVAVFAYVFKALLARTTEVGSRTLLAGATAGQGSHGMFMSDGKNRQVEAWILTKKGAEVQKRVYEQTLKVLEEVEPGISKNI
jgi:retinol dehydrogenase 12